MPIPKVMSRRCAAKHSTSVSCAPIPFSCLFTPTEISYQNEQQLHHSANLPPRSPGTHGEIGKCRLDFSSRPHSRSPLGKCPGARVSIYAVMTAANLRMVACITAKRRAGTHYRCPPAVCCSSYPQWCEDRTRTPKHYVGDDHQHRTMVATPQCGQLSARFHSMRPLGSLLSSSSAMTIFRARYQDPSPLEVRGLSRC